MQDSKIAMDTRKKFSENYQQLGNALSQSIARPVIDRLLIWKPVTLL
jgi:hypothetical protein